MRKTVILLALLALALTQGTEEEIKAQQTEMSMKRTACLVLSRYHSNTQKDAIESVVNELAPEQQQKYINKMYAVAVEHCLPTITMDEAQKFFVEDPSFSPQDMFYIFDNFDYTAVVNDLDTLTKTQESLIKFMKNFDEEMQVRREEREAEETEATGDEQFEMKFFGFSFYAVPSVIKNGYFIVFMVIVISAIAYLYSKLDDGKKKAKTSKRRSPKKDQTKKKA